MSVKRICDICEKNIVNTGYIKIEPTNFFLERVGAELCVDCGRETEKFLVDLKKKKRGEKIKNEKR